MKALKAIIFDFDGTLLDSRRPSLAGANRILARRGQAPIDMERFNEICHDGVRYLICSAAGADMEREGEQLEREMIEACKSVEEVFVYEGIPETLRALKDAGLRLAIHSNNVPDVLAVQLRLGGIADFFEFIQGDDGEVPLKPDPAGLVRVMEKLGVSNEEVLLVGDSSIDLRTARAAGVACCFAAYGIGTLPQGERAEYCIRTPQELLPLARRRMETSEEGTALC